jgi:hypothetical protein
MPELFLVLSREKMIYLIKPNSMVKHGISTKFGKAAGTGNTTCNG